MSMQPSLRSRGLFNQSVRGLQPRPWINSLGSTFLAFNNNGSSMTASATPNTPGSWIQYIASNAVPATSTIHALHIQCVGNNQAANTDNSMLLDIAKGASGSETIIAQNIAVGGAWNTGGAGPFFMLPIRIEGATRVAMRVRAATGSRVLTMQNIIAYGHSTLKSFSDRLPTSVDTLGTSISTSTGTAMSGSSGTWVEIVSATTKDYQGLIIVPSGPANISGAVATTFRLDLGIGLSGNEIPVAFVSGSYGSNGFIYPLYITATPSIYGGFVPAGTRIAIRHNLAANPERVCACVIGVPYV